MKKLIGIFAILLIATVVFGQKFVRDELLMVSIEKGQTTVEDYVHFEANDRVFLLAYEPVPNRTMNGLVRNIYLYSKDISDVTSSWELASDMVYTGRFGNAKNYNDVDFYRSSKSRGSVGTVNVLDDSVEMTIGVSERKNGIFIYDITEITFVFTPKSTNFYSVRK